MKNRPIAITVPNETKNCWDENLKDRKPTISVKIATISAAEVKIVPFRIAALLASREKSRRVVLPCGFAFSWSCNSSLILATTCKP